MKKQWKRLFVAAVISSSVFGATYFWYQYSGNRVSSLTNEKPLAYVGKVVEDIQRRPAARLLWQEVNGGEPLYNGEAVRSSERGEVRIQFADSDRYLDLEPESLIVIKKSEGEISLDLMEGSLFVNAQAGAADEKSPGLVLNSANGKVDLSQASAALSKGSGNSVDVQVLEGKASMKSKDGQKRELTQGSTGALGSTGFSFNKNDLMILSPVPQKPIAMDAEDLKPVLFQWKGFPADSQVSLYIGSTRRNLREIAKASDPQKSELSAKIPFGKHFWKLVAKDPTGRVIGESSVQRTEVVARYAPTVVFPPADAEVPANTSPFDMTFKWERAEDTRQMTLEVWADPELKRKVTTQSFVTEESFTLPKIKEGTYYWRMSSYFVDAEKPLMGKIQKFTVKPPALVKVETERPPIVPVKISFSMPESQHYTESPRLGLTWTADKPENVASWRVKYHAEDEDPALATPVDLKEPKLSADVPKPGRYIASIEALDKNGSVVGTGISTPLTVAPLPPLRAPQFLPMEGQLQAANDGRSQLQWESVEGAKEYWLTIKKNGKELKKARYTSSSTALKNLLPGEYEVEISAVDQYGRNSEIAPARKLLVPDKSGLKAPTLKKIKVN